MRLYRLVLILKSDLKKDRKQKLLDDVKKWVGGIKSDRMTEIGEKKLAYSIRREKKGEYILLEFESEKVASDLEKRIIMQEDILRHLLIRIK